ncbi:MAG TPA: phage tail tape measure protein [Gammaproteobacteria bacterium]|nr:phage tail tape measure protein [Gammaproteobacteria bacterium]
MSGSMRASFTLTLNDKLTAGLANIARKFQGLDQLGKKLTLGKLERGADTLRTLSREVQGLTSDFRGLSAAIDRGWAGLKRIANAPMQRLRNAGRGMIEHGGKLQQAAMAAGGAYAIYKPMHEYADFDRRLRQIAITEGYSGGRVGREVARLRGNFQTDALASGQSSESIAEAFQDLIRMGLTGDMAEKLLPIHSKAATAYGVSAAALGPLVGSLSSSMGIGEADMPSALAAMAMAAKHGRVGVADFSRYMPEIAGQMSMMGMKGMPGATTAFAALETVVRNSADPAAAATNFADALRYIMSPAAARAFALHGKMIPPEIRKMMPRGIDLPALLMNAEKKGMDPLRAVLDTLGSLVRGKSAVQGGELLGTLLHNQQAGTAIMALIAHRSDFEQMNKELGQASPATFMQDFQTMFGSLGVQMDLLTEKMAQLNQRAGEGFAPLMKPVNMAIDALMSGIGRLDQSFPGLGDAVLMVTGGLLGLASLLAGLGFIAPAVAGGWGLVGGGAMLAGAGAVLASPAVLTAGVGAVAGGSLYLGSKYETPETRAALEKLHQEQRSLDGGPNGLPHDGYGLDGRPVDGLALTPPPSSAAAAPQKGELVIRLDGPLNGQVTQSIPGMNLHLHAGRTTTQP